MRASLDQASTLDAQLKKWARSNDQNDMYAVRLTLKETGDAASGAYCLDIAQWGHRNAEYSLWNVEADNDSYRYNPEQPATTFTLATAESSFTRAYSQRLGGLHIFEISIATNYRVAGYWEGRQLGLISFLAEAGKAFGVTIKNKFVAHTGWGVFPGAPQARISAAFQDVRSFRSSVHAPAYKVGAWRVRQQDTQTAMSLGWVINFLFCSTSKLADVMQLKDYSHATVGKICSSTCIKLARK